MGTTFVIRHQGAREWMKKQPIHIDYWTDDLEIDLVKAGDIVIGILPMKLAAEVCKKGAHFVALQIDVPKNRRGSELSKDDLEEMQCSLCPYYVTAIESNLFE